MAPSDPAIEEARRRVYSPRATEQDRAEYRRLLADAELRRAPGPRPAGGGRPDPGPPRTRPALGPRRTAVLLGAVAAAAVVSAVFTALPRAAEGERVPAPTPVAVDAATRATFLFNLGAGRAAGIAAYVRTQLAQTPLRGTARLVAIERSGGGPQSMAIRPPADAPASGRATVILVVSRSARVGWTLSAAPYLHAGDANNVIGTRAGDAEPGTPSFASLRYHVATAPAVLRVEVPDGVRWGVAVVLSD